MNFYTGGTLTAIIYANRNNIPVFNLRIPSRKAKLL